MGVTPQPPPDLTTMADALTLLGDTTRRLAERVVLATLTLDERLGGTGCWDEDEVAALAGLTKHQARQAIAPLVTEGVLERVYVPRSDGSRPRPAYVWAKS